MKEFSKTAKILILILAAFLVSIALFVLIREDYLVMATVALVGAGVIILLVRKPAWMVYLLIVFCCVEKFLISQLGFPDAIDYATDLLMMICFVLAIKELIEKRQRYHFANPLLLAIGFFVCGTITALFNQVNLLLLIWSYRNLMRFFIFFFSCAVILEDKDIDNLIKILKIVFHGNIIAVSFQFWIQGYSQDNLGGLFGTQMGCNGYMNTFLCAYVAYICIAYMSKKISFLYFLYVSAGSLYIAALSELKFWFIEFVLILIISVVISKFSVRTLFILLGACVGLYIGFQLFSAIFPGWNFTLDQIVDYAGRGGYSTETDLNRMTAIQRISKEFFYTPMKLLWGYGLGSCETSSFFNSDFFMQYGNSLHYTYLLHAFIFLETGAAGLIMYLAFYVVIFAKALYYRLKVTGVSKIYCGMAAITALSCILQTFYNNALRVENSGYLAYAVLAVPFICMKGEKKENDRKKS